MTQCGATRVGIRALPTVEHHLDRVAVEPDAVLDGRDSRLQRVLDAGVGLRVRHDLAALRCGLVDGGLDLVERQRRVVRLVAWRKDAARGAELDPVGAGADHLAHAKAHRLDAVDDHVRPVGQRDVEVGAAHEMRVGVAARLAERADRDEHARTREVAGIDRHPDSRRRAGRVADRRESRVERAPRGSHRAHQLERRRRGQLAREVEAFTEVGEVDVAVDEAREQREAGGVDRLGVARHLSSLAPAGLRDAAVLDEHDRLASRFSGRRVQKRVAGDGGDHEAMLRLDAIAIAAAITRHRSPTRIGEALVQFPRGPPLALRKAVEDDVPALDPDRVQHPVRRPRVLSHPRADRLPSRPPPPNTSRPPSSGPTSSTNPSSNSASMYAACWSQPSCSRMSRDQSHGPPRSTRTT